jgi:putative transposase
VKHDLWRAVDQQGKVLANVVTKTRDLKPALKSFKKLMKRHGKPGSVVTDRFSFNGAALKDLGRGDDQEMGRCINNRVENRHLPFRRRYQAMLRFRRLQALQMFASGLTRIQNHYFPTGRHLLDRDHLTQFRSAALPVWRRLLAA